MLGNSKYFSLQVISLQKANAWGFSECINQWEFKTPSRSAQWTPKYRGSVWFRPECLLAKVLYFECILMPHGVVFVATMLELSILAETLIHHCKLHIKSWCHLWYHLGGTLEKVCMCVMFTETNLVTGSELPKFVQQDQVWSPSACVPESSALPIKMHKLLDRDTKCHS